MTKNENAYILRWAKKIRAINHLGGKCKSCSNDDIFVLEFHHNGGITKECDISNLLSYRWSRLIEELDKCKLLCSNCHAEFHCNQSSRQSNNKLKLLNSEKITGCSKCNYIGRNYGSLEFHHKNQAEKSFMISDIMNRNISSSVSDIDGELSKCVILCRNCHIKEHIDQDRFKTYENDIYRRVKTHREIQPEISRQAVREMLESGMKQVEIAKHFNAAKSTISNIVKQLT
jgi:hypothetical protein